MVPSGGEEITNNNTTSEQADKHMNKILSSARQMADVLTHICEYEFYD